MRAGVATAEVGVLHDHDGPSILLRPLRAGSRKALAHDSRRVSFRVITSGVSLTLCLADGPERSILARTEFLRSTGGISRSKWPAIRRSALKSCSMATS